MSRPIAARDSLLALALGLALVAANAAYVSAHMGFLHAPEQVVESDHLRYLAMAGGPEGYADRVLAHRAPFCYRLLIPWLAWALSHLGFGVDAAFYLLSQLFGALFLAALFLLLRSSGFRREEAVLGVVLTALLPGAIRWYAYQYWMTDPIALFLVTLAFLLIRRDRYAPLSQIGVLALMARESYLLVLPYLFLRELRRGGARAAALRSAAAFAVPIVVMLLIRYYVVASPGRPLAAEIQRIVDWRGEGLLDNQLYLVTIGSFGVLFAAALVPTARSLRAWLQRPEDLSVLAIVYASLLVGVNTDRLLVYAVPVVVPVALRALAHLGERTRVPFDVLAYGAVMVQLVFYVRTPFTGAQISNRQPFDPVVALCIAGFWLFCGLAWLDSRRRRAV
jgi:hypothetical protein